MVVLGRVESSPTGLAWRVIFPDSEHAAAAAYLRELAASDCSTATLRSYAFDLLRWFRFLHDRLIGWERAERVDVRAFIEHLRETPNPQRLRRRADGPPPGSVNVVTGKAELSAKYAARTINHQLSVLFGFYEHACAADLGPLVNPVPAQRTRRGTRPNAHHNPMQDFVIHRRANYRQKTPRPVWRAIPDEALPRILLGTQATARPPTFVLFTRGFLEPGTGGFWSRVPAVSGVAAARGVRFRGQPYSNQRAGAGEAWVATALTGSRSAGGEVCQYSVPERNERGVTGG